MRIDPELVIHLAATLYPSVQESSGVTRAEVAIDEAIALIEITPGKIEQLAQRLADKAPKVAVPFGSPVPIGSPVPMPIHGDPYGSRIR